MKKFTVYTKQSNDQIAMFLYLPSGFPGRSLSFSIERILRPDIRSCDIVERWSSLILFSLEIDLSPEQLVTIKTGTILKLFPHSKHESILHICIANNQSPP